MSDEQASEAEPVEVQKVAQDVVGPPRGYVDYFSVIYPDLLVLVGWFPGGDGETELLLSDETGTTPVTARSVAFARADIPLPDALAGKFCVARIPAGVGPTTSLLLRSNGEPIRLYPTPVERSRVDLDTLALRLGQLDGRLKHAALKLLHDAIRSETVDTARPLQNRHLARLHAALRATHPTTQPGAETTGLLVERLIEIDPRTFFLTGWLWSSDATPIRLTMVSPEGFRAEILPYLHRFHRPDIEQLYGVPASGHFRHTPGFAGVFQLPTNHLSTRSEGWTIELHDDSDSTFEAPCPRVLRDERQAVDALLALLDRTLDNSSRNKLLAHHVGIGVRHAQHASSTRASVHDVLHFGPRATRPSTSLLFTLTGTVQSIQHQLAALGSDPDLSSVELIYLFSAPTFDVDMQRLFQSWFDLYRVPFSVAILRGLPGRGASFNLGLDVAQGRRVVLGSTMLLPQTPGWLTTLHNAFDAQDRIGLIAPLLLNMDDTIDSAGFETPSATEMSGEVVSVRHAGCLGSSLPDLRPYEVDAASIDGAMMDRDVLIDIGRIAIDMLSDKYLSVKLCHALASQGLSNRCHPEVRLYRLGGHVPDQTAAHLYDRWNLSLATA